MTQAAASLFTASAPAWQDNPMSDPENPTLPQANIYILQGDDELSIQEVIHNLVERVDSGAFAGMNSVRLDGRTIKSGEMANHVNMLPLGGSKRLVILDYAVEALKAKADQEWLAEMVKSMSETTVLVLVIPDSQKYKNGEMVWQAAGKSHWLRKSLKESGKSVEWVEKPLPSLREMPEWIMNEAHSQGANFDGRAAAELANLVGNDLYQARQEITKALNYCGKDQPITRDVVRLLCSQSREEDIFDMVDAVGQRDARKALGLLRALMQDQPIQYVFTMLVRQARLLIKVREAMDEGGGEKDVVSACGVAPFIARKLIDQCRRFNMRELESIFRQLDTMDESSKTGTATLEVELETLVAELSR
jgi:DNA polymerase-3 subunit delta